MYILGIHNGNHDASACLFRDYELVAAVSLERLTRKKNDGISPSMEIPLPAIDECLRIAGIGRADVDVVCASRAHWEVQTYKLRGRWWIKQQYYRLIGNERITIDDRHDAQAAHQGCSRDFRCCRVSSGTTDSTRPKLFFYNHHAAHGLPAYFFSEFDDALIYTADGIGDNISYSASHRAARRHRGSVRRRRDA